MSMAGAAVMAHRGAGRPTMPLSHHALDASSFPVAPVQRSNRPAPAQTQHQLQTTVAASVAAQGARSAAPTPRSVSSGHPSPRSNAPELVISGARYEPSTTESDTRQMRPAVAAVQHAPRSAAPQSLVTDSRDRMQIDTAPSPSVAIHAGVSAIRALIDNFRHAPAMDPQERKESINANMLWWTKPSAHAPMSPPACVVSPRAVASRLGSPTRLASSSSTELYNAEVARSNRVRSPNFQRQQRHSVESKSSAQDSVTPQSPQPALRASGIRTSIDVPLATANTALSPPPRRALTPGSGPTMPPLRLKALNDVAKADASLAASLVAGLKQKPSVESSSFKSSHPHPLELTGGLHVDALQRVSADEFVHHDQFDMIPDAHNDSDEGVCLVDADMSDSGVRDSIDDDDAALLADLQATRDEVRAEMQQQRVSQSTFKEGSLSETMMHDALALLQGPPPQSVSESVQLESVPAPDTQPDVAVPDKPRRPSLFELAQQERLQQEQVATQPSAYNADVSPDQEDADFPVFTLRKSALAESLTSAEAAVEPVVESESAPVIASEQSSALIPESVPQSVPVSEVVEEKSALTGIPGSLRHLPASVIDPLYLTTRNFEPTLSPIQSVALSSSSHPASTAPAATPSEHVDVARSQSLWDMSTSDVHDLDAGRSVPTTPMFVHAPAGVGALVDISASLNASLASLGTAKPSEVQNTVEENSTVKTDVALTTSAESQVPQVEPIVAPPASAPSEQSQPPVDVAQSSSVVQSPTQPTAIESTSIPPPTEKASVDNLPAANVNIPTSTPAEPLTSKEQTVQPTPSVPTPATQPAPQPVSAAPVAQPVPQAQPAPIPQPAPAASIPLPASQVATPPATSQTTTPTQSTPVDTIATPVVGSSHGPTAPDAKPLVPVVASTKPENKLDAAPAPTPASVATSPVQPSELKPQSATPAAPQPVAAKAESVPKPTPVPQPSTTATPSTEVVNVAPAAKPTASTVSPVVADLKPATVEPRAFTPSVASQSPRPVTSVNTGLETERAALQRDIERLRAELSAVTAATSAATNAAAAATAAAEAATTAANQATAAQKPANQIGDELDLVQALGRVADNVAKKTAVDVPPISSVPPVSEPLADVDKPIESTPIVVSHPNPVPVVPSIDLPVIPAPPIPASVANSNIASPVTSPFVSPRSVGAPSTALNTARTAFTDQLSIAPSVVSSKLPARVDLSRGSNVPLNLRRAVFAASSKVADKNIEMETLVSSVAKLADSIAALTTMLQPSEKELPTHSALVQPAGAQPSRVESPVSHISDSVESHVSASPLSPAKPDEHRLPHSRSIQTLAPALCVAHTQTDPVPVSPERTPVSAPAPSASTPAAPLPPASMASAVIPGFDVWGTAMQSLQQQLQLQIQLQQLQLQNQLNNNLSKPAAVDAAPARSNSPPSRQPSVDQVSVLPPTPPSAAPVPEFEWPSLPPPDYFDLPPIAPPAYSQSREVADDEPNDFPANGRKYRVPYPLLTSLRVAPPSSHPSPRSVIDSILKVNAQPIVVQSYQPVAAPPPPPTQPTPAPAITPMPTKPRDLSRSVSIAATVPARPLVPSASSASLKAAQAASMLSDDESDQSPLLKPSSSTSSLISPAVPIKNNPSSAISSKSNALAAAALLGSDDDDDDLLDLAG